MNNNSQLKEEYLEYDELGMAYNPASKATFRLDTQVPDSMASETQAALIKIEMEVGGDIDNFVRDRLGYKTKTELYKSLSAEQIDAVAMSIYNIEGRRQGIIIGDQTGIGKGRVAASIIRYATHQGLKPVFLTEKANLFSDIYRDLFAIGSGHLVPFIVNGRESKTDIKNEEGEIIFQAPIASTQKSVFESKSLPKQYDFVLATYSQFNSAEKKPEKPDFLAAIAPDNVFILDEAHNSSGSSNTGAFLQGIVGATKGAVFLSATFAKRPDNMPIYAMKTAMADCAMSNDELVDAITKGGVALQEILASQLVEEGQMLRRERSYEGIEVNYLTLDSLTVEHRAIADNITEILRDIIQFQKSFILPLIEQMDKAVAAVGKEAGARKGTADAGVDSTPYFSKVFNVINQMLFAIKAESVADRAILRLKEGKKPVIAFASTMGAFLEGMENQSGLPIANGDVINADFSEVLMRGLDGVMLYTEKAENGESVYKRLMLAEIDNDAQVDYNRISSKIRNATTGLCISPIDIVVKKITEAGYKVAEVTGRKYELQLNIKSIDLPKPSLNGLGNIPSGSIMGMLLSRKRINTNDAFRQFNNNEVDVLMINQSGSTGASAHAIPTAKVAASDVQQRVMIVLQAELDINTEVQKRGRINRTGQLKKPIYDYVTSAIPAENRLMMMLQKKLKSLDANTTSNQKNSSAILDVPDFLNKYGDKVVRDYLIENPTINEILDDPLKLKKDSDGDNDSDADAVENAAHRVSGRVAVLATQDQHNFYVEITERYTNYVDYLKQSGDYDLEVEAMNLEAETINQKVIDSGTGAASAFGNASTLETVRANVLKKPFTSIEMDNLLKDTLQGQEPKVLQEIMTNSFVQFSSDRWSSEESELQNKFAGMLANVHTEKKITKIEDDNERFAALSERQKAIEESRLISLELAQKKHDNKRDYLKDLFRFFFAARSLKFPLESYSGGKESIPCVFLGFQIDLRKTNPYAPSSVILRFAIANGAKYIAIPASYSEVVYSIMGASGRTTQPESISILLSEWETACQGNSVDRKVRHIITGNLLQAFGRFKGKLVSYTTLDGGVKKGILMPENWDASKEVADKVIVPITKGASIIKSLTNGHITTNNGVGFVRYGVDFKIIVPLSRKAGGGVYLDKDLLALVKNNLFEKSGDKMVAKLEIAQFDEFISVLQRNHKSTIVIQSFQLAQLSKDVAPGSTYKIKAPGAAPNEVLLEQMEIDEMEIEALALMLELELLDLDPVALSGVTSSQMEALAVRLDYDLMQMA